MEIAIQSKDGLGAKPLPIKVILTWVASIVICFYIITHTIISKGAIWQIIMFVILWLLMTLLLAKYDGTKRMQAELSPALLNYIPKGNRHIITRTSSDSGAFWQIVGRESINQKTGLIEFTDGTFGFGYRVVGSASILLFDDDKNAILNRVDSFYRKMGCEVECIFITTKSAQTVYKQVANLKRRYDSLEVRDPDLRNLANEQFHVLKHYVGGSFKSVHQYLILKADNKEVLMQSKNVLQSEVENSSLMIKKCEALTYQDTCDVSRIIYRGKET